MNVLVIKHLELQTEKELQEHVFLVSGDSEQSIGRKVAGWKTNSNKWLGKIGKDRPRSL